MTPGERAALEGVLSELKPALAIEIGTAEGGSLRRIAVHSREVHSFDLVAPDLSAQELENVTLHTGDSHALLPQVLDELAAASRNVDFVLVDGDHTAEGVRRDMVDLMASPAVGETTILVHDTANDIVRAGLTSFEDEHGGEALYLDLDFVAGHLSHGEPYHHELWGGLGLVVVDRERGGSLDSGPAFYAAFELFATAREAIRAAEGTDGAAGSLAAVRDALQTGATDLDGRERARLEERCAALGAELEAGRAELAALRDVVGDITSSASWRATAPLRTGKRALAGVRSRREK